MVWLNHNGSVQPFGSEVASNVSIGGHTYNIWYGTQSMASTNTQSKTATGYKPVLDDAERASRDEIVALQTKRMAWTLAHAYGNVAHYRQAFDARSEFSLLRGGLCLRRI